MCERKYHSAQESEEMFKEVGIELKYMKDEIQEYEGRKIENEDLFNEIG